MQSFAVTFAVTFAPNMLYNMFSIFNISGISDFPNKGYWRLVASNWLRLAVGNWRLVSSKLR